MKITIVGAGSIGCLFASILSKAKNDVWLLDKNINRAEIISKNGIKIDGVSGKWEAFPKITTQAENIDKPDLIIICVKSYDTKEAVKQIKPLVSEQTYTLTLQNGLGNSEIIAEATDSDKVLAGVTNQAANRLNENKILHAGCGETIIGSTDKKMPVILRTIREIFNAAGIHTKTSKDIKSVLWSKLVINTGINAISGITGLSNGKLIEIEEARKILREAVAEAVKIAKKKKVKLIYDDPLTKVEAVCEATALNTSSMLQDILKKKRTEIDSINGLIIREGQSLGIPTPVNSVLVNLIKTIEKSYVK